MRSAAVLRSVPAVLAAAVAVSVALPSGLAGASPDEPAQPPPTTSDTTTSGTAPEEPTPTTSEPEATPPTTSTIEPEPTPATTIPEEDEDEEATPPTSATEPAPVETTPTEPEPTSPPAEPEPRPAPTEPAPADPGPADQGDEIQASTTAAKRTWANGCISKTLYPRNSGPQVRCLKRRLRNLNFPVDTTGYYGIRTSDAVSQIKRSRGLPSDGVAGPKALDVIFNPNRPSARTWGKCITRTLSPGVRGYQVRCLEKRLRRLNFPVVANGRYGRRVTDAVAQIKRDAGLARDGTAGPTALNSIFNPNRSPIRSWGSCITRQLNPGDRSYQVACLQKRLKRMNLLATVDGHYGIRTRYAVNVIKRRGRLRVDGIAGPKMLTKAYRSSLPAPVRRGYDTEGKRLSPVAAAGPNAPLPPGRSGTGKRIVYSRGQQRVWAIGPYGGVIRSWLVSGSLYDNEPAGTHRVYSRSRYGTAYTGSGMLLPYMVRWYYTPKGNHIGFHEIPRNSSGQPIQTVWELGQPRSAGCTRQAYLDAIFLWNWAPIGTKMVVV